MEPLVEAARFWLPLRKESEGERPVGKLMLSIELVPHEQAALLPAGEGHAEPNSHPTLPPPPGQLEDAKIYKWLYRILGPKVRVRVRVKVRVSPNLALIPPLRVRVRAKVRVSPNLALTPTPTLTLTLSLTLNQYLRRLVLLALFGAFGYAFVTLFLAFCSSYASLYAFYLSPHPSILAGSELAALGQRLTTELPAQAMQLHAWDAASIPPASITPPSTPRPAGHAEAGARRPFLAERLGANGTAAAAAAAAAASRLASVTAALHLAAARPSDGAGASLTGASPPPPPLLAPLRSWPPPPLSIPPPPLSSRRPHHRRHRLAPRRRRHRPPSPVPLSAVQGVSPRCAASP